MAKLRLGFVGAGTMGQAAHLRNYATLPDCEVVALAELRPKLREAVAVRYQIPNVYPSHREMLGAEKLDGIVAIQQFQDHVSLVPDLLDAGVPVLTEKPLADSLENGEKLLHAAKDASAPLYLAYHKRSDPATALVKSTILKWQGSGEVGKLRYVRITMPPGDWSWDGFASNVWTDEPAGSSFAPANEYIEFVNYYIHQLNLMRYLIGEDYEVVFADPGGVTLGTCSQSGISGTIEMAPYSTSRDWQESAFVAFERGWIRLDLPAPLVLDQPGTATVFQDTKAGATTTSPSLPHTHAMRAQAANFLNAIRGEDHPLCGVEDAYRDLLVAASYIELFGKTRRRFACEPVNE